MNFVTRSDMRPLALALSLVVLTIGAVPAWAQGGVVDPNTLPYGPATCAQGFVWREAYERDVVCVTPATRAQALADNAVAASRRAPGSLNCVSGYVWRVARPEDLVCVPPETRTQTAADNSVASMRRAVAVVVTPGPPTGAPTDGLVDYGVIDTDGQARLRPVTFVRLDELAPTTVAFNWKVPCESDGDPRGPCTVSGFNLEEESSESPGTWIPPREYRVLLAGAWTGGYGYKLYELDNQRTYSFRICAVHDDGRMCSDYTRVTTR